VPYLGEVAQLERAVAEVRHAPDSPPLDAAALARVAQLDAAAQSSLRLLPHPAVRMLHTAFPAAAIWRAVLDHDDAALGRIDLGQVPDWLLVERAPAGIDVIALGEGEWRLTAALVAGHPVEQALEAVAGRDDVDASALIARHLVAGRFAGFHAAPWIGTAAREEAST
jgi:hypothetical protein